MPDRKVAEAALGQQQRERKITLDTRDGRQWIWRPEAGGWRVYRGHGDGGLYTEHVFTIEDMLEWTEEALKP